MRPESQELKLGGTASYPDLKGKVAVLTGSSKGIGAAAATALAGNGVRVVVNGRDVAAVSAVEAGIRRAGGEAVGVSGDALDLDVLEALGAVAWTTTKQRLVPGGILGRVSSFDWFISIALVPVIGGLWYLIECGFLKGTIGPNNYGPDPLLAG